MSGLFDKFEKDLDQMNENVTINMFVDILHFSDHFTLNGCWFSFSIRRVIYTNF